MAGFTNALENEMLDHMFETGSYSTPGTLYLALFTTNPDFETGAFGGTEVSGTNYSRKAVAMTSTNWNAAVDASPNGKKATNKGTAAFQFGTAGSNWGTINGAALVSTSSGDWSGTGIGMSFGGALTTPKTVNQDDSFEFPADSIEVSLDKATEAGISDYWKAKVLDHVTGVAAYTFITTGYVALYTAEPNYITGSGGTEVTGGAYARKSVTMASSWAAASGGANSNSGAITFVQATANWGTVLGAALMDNSTGGNMLTGKTLTASKQVDSGDTFSIATGDFDNTLD